MNTNASPGKAHTMLSSNWNGFFSPFLGTTTFVVFWLLLGFPIACVITVSLMAARWMLVQKNQA